MSPGFKLPEAITTDEKALAVRSFDTSGRSFQALYGFIEADEIAPDDLIFPHDEAQFGSSQAGDTLFESM